MFRWLLFVLVGQCRGSAEDVRVETGTPPFTVRGVRGDGGEYSVFYGIPFSAKRTPPHRFEPPEDYVHDAGEIYDATDQKARCVQGADSEDEDCLYLDIYAPRTRGAARPDYPVLVWIHGGAWRTGSKNDYSGVLWASQEWTPDVNRAVVVTVNYRLNTLGFPMDILARRYNLTRNLGLRDNIQALRWVKSHIGSFHGDSNSITIFGESAGAVNVMLLWASPAARGLFHRAISQSPYIWDYAHGTFFPEASYLEAHERSQIRCLEGAIENACGDSTESCFFSARNVSYEDMMGAPACSPLRLYGPVVEDGLISATFYEDLCGTNGTTDVGAGVPLLVGHNSLEIIHFRDIISRKRAQNKEWVRHLANLSDGTPVFRCLGDLYRASGRAQRPHLPRGSPTVEEVYAASGIQFNMISQTLARLPNVFMFLFNESAEYEIDGGPGCSKPKGGHGCEIPLVITRNGITDVDTAVQRTMRHHWAFFAKHGKPGWNEWEVGVFQDGEVAVRNASAAFIPEASELLNSLMCSPASINETCGEYLDHFGDRKRWLQLIIYLCMALAVLGAVAIIFFIIWKCCCSARDSGFRAME